LRSGSKDDLASDFFGHVDFSFQFTRSVNCRFLILDLIRFATALVICLRRRHLEVS
jgi:hypothetical protein